ncbi:MAG: cupin domain-containing protein [Gammaproteobacteria bacterium]
MAYDVITGLVDDFDLEHADVSDVRTLLQRCRRMVERRLADALPTKQRRPMVLDPARLDGQMSRQGQRLTPVITSEVACTSGLSSAYVWMPPHHTSYAHLHKRTDVAVLVLYGRAITLWWDDNEELHELPQDPGQHLHIPYGVPHTAINPFDVPVIAAEFRSNVLFNADNVLLPYLDDEVRTLARRPTAA